MLGDEFRKARSRCILYEGKTVCLYDELPVQGESRLLLTFESTNSEWRQGVRIGDMTRDTDLRLTVAGQTAPGVQLWADTSPHQVEIAVNAPRNKVYVYNVWDIGNGQPCSQMTGAGMIVEVSALVDTMRYDCNDGHPVPSFDHLVFSITVLD